MIVLGIETSCDETAAAVVENGVTVHSHVVNSQIDIHAQYGGVVPEVAARSHIEVVNAVIDKALADANVTIEDVDAIGVTRGAGLSGSLLVGTLAAKTLAWLYDKPLYGVNHVLGHLYANFIDDLHPSDTFPILGLIVSGGHTQIVLFKDHYDYTLLGKTGDDAVGEAFDKVAKIIGLPYPGGPSVEKTALSGDPEAYRFTKPRITGRPYDFSYSGLKTGVLRKCQEIVGGDSSLPSFEISPLLNSSQRNDIAASFQKAALEMIVERMALAEKEHSPAQVFIGGGVAASRTLRAMLSEGLQTQIKYPDFTYCTDNASMIASLTYFEAQHREADSVFEMTLDPALKM